jgi:hypothetical protein
MRKGFLASVAALLTPTSQDALHNLALTPPAALHIEADITNNPPSSARLLSLAGAALLRLAAEGRAVRQGKSLRTCLITSLSLVLGAAPFEHTLRRLFREET